MKYVIQLESPKGIQYLTGKMQPPTDDIRKAERYTDPSYFDLCSKLSLINMTIKKVRVIA